MRLSCGSPSSFPSMMMLAASAPRCLTFSLLHFETWQYNQSSSKAHAQVRPILYNVLALSAD